MQQESPVTLDFYRRRARDVESLAEEANGRSSLRFGAWVLLSLLACVFLYESFVAKKLPLWPVILPIAAAAVLMRPALQQWRRTLKLDSVREYYERGIARLKHDWESLDDGKDFVDPKHIYATDLDLFGRGSLFQLLCSARTHVGRETLATWMKTSANREEVLARQEAIVELRARDDLFETVAAAGKSAVSDCRPSTFREWVAAMSSRPRFPSWAPPVAFVLAFVLAGLPFLYWSGYLSIGNLWASVVAVAAVEAAFATLFAKRVRFILESVRLPSMELPVVCELLEIIEREQFRSAKLAALSDLLKAGGSAVSRKLRQLNRLVRLLKERDNQWFTALSWCLLWGTQFSMGIDRWHRRHGSKLLDWLGALGEFEALLSLAAYSREHPADIFPEITEEGPVFDAEQLGHPLIDEGICVRNDVRLGDGVRFFIVSGSNMSGKSTFLRAVGLNAVLAWMGAPVRCAKLRVSALSVAAAISVQDSLVDGRSHFFAEMERLRRVIDMASEGPVLFLADEIMIGTNSRDRRIAAEWVIRALVARNAIGLVSTHDLTLTEIAGNGLPGRNVYFEDTGEGGALKFDYKLRSGLLKRSNALNIVRMLGIDAETR